MRKQRIKVNPRLSEKAFGQAEEMSRFDYASANCDTSYIESRVARAEMEIGQLHSDMNSVDSGFQSLMGEIDSTGFQIKDHDRRLMSLEVNTGNSVELANLSNRVTMSESKIGEVNTRLTILESDKSNGGSHGHHLDFTPIAARLSAAEANIMSNATKVGDHDSRIADLEKVSGVTDLKPLQDKVVDMIQSVDTIEAGHKAQEMRITSLEAIHGGGVDLELIKDRLDAVETSSGNNKIVLDAVQNSLETNTGTITTHETRIDALERGGAICDNDLTTINAILEAHAVDISTLETKVNLMEGGDDCDFDLTHLNEAVLELRVKDNELKGMIDENKAAIRRLELDTEGYDDTELRMLINDVKTTAAINSNQIDNLVRRIDDLVAGGGGITHFTDLSDTPSTYIGQAGRMLVVNPTSTGLTFAKVPTGGGTGGGDYDDSALLARMAVVEGDVSAVEREVAEVSLEADRLDTRVSALELAGPGEGGGGATTFRALTDTPNSYAGQNGRFLAVNGSGTGVEFVNAPTGGGGGDYDDSALRAMIADLDTTKAENTTVTALDARVDALEAAGPGGGGGGYDDTELREMITALDTDKAETHDLNVLRTRVHEAEQAIDALEAAGPGGGGGGYDDTALSNRVTAVENINDTQTDDINALETRVNALEAGGGGEGGGATITSATLMYPWVATAGNNSAADTTKLETNSVLNCGTSGHNITLPRVKDVPDQVIRYITTQHPCTVTCHDDDVIWMPKPGSDAKSVTLGAGDCLALVSYHEYNGWGRLFHAKG